jgi:hypothetical protein
MSRIHIPYWLAVVCSVACFACHSYGGDLVPILVCELRAPKVLNPDSKTRVSLASCSSESGHFLWAFNQKEQKEEGGFLLFQPDSFVLHAEPESRRAVIVQKFPAPAQVFRLSLPKNPNAADWSQWRRPDCTADGDVGWSVIYNQKLQGVSTNIPSDCFELRYKIEMKDLGPAWNPGMKRKSGEAK